MRHSLPRGGIILLALLAMAPDADYLLRLISDTFYLQHHRGITHSILMLPLWTWLIYSLLPARRRDYPAMPWLIAAALALHITLDLITSFGTMIYAPFSDARIAWDLVFIIDPLFTGILALPLLCALIWRRRARVFALASLLFMASYTGLALIMHHAAVTIVRQEQPAADAVDALPQPFSPFRWQLVASYPDHYSRTVIDLLPGFPGSGVLFPDSFVRRFSGDIHPSGELQWQQLPAMRSQPDIGTLPGVSFYRWFARFPVLLEKGPDKLVFGDLRFGAGAIADSAFRLEINLGKVTPKAWLVWHTGERSAIR